MSGLWDLSNIKPNFDILLPGDTLTLRYGSASATLVLPAAGFTPRR